MFDAAAGPQTEAELLQLRPPSNRPGTFPQDLLAPGERVLFETKPTLVGLYVGRLTVLGLLDALWIAVAIGLPTNPTGGLFTALTTIPMIYYVLKWRSSAYALTNRRVLSVVGIRQPNLMEALLGQVRNLRLEPGSAGGIKFDATPPDAPTTLLGTRKYAKTIYWRALPLSSRTYEFVQQVFAFQTVEASRSSLRADLVARIAENTIPCEYCGTLVDPNALDPLNPKCPSCGAPFVPVELRRAAAQARVEQPAYGPPPPPAAVPGASPPVLPGSAGTGSPTYRPPAPAPATARLPRPATAPARPLTPAPPSPAPPPAGGPGTDEREPPHRLRNRRALSAPRSTLLLVAVALLVTTSGFSVGPVVGAVARVGVHLEPGLSTNGVSPPPTTGAAATFDSSDGYVLMFGGLDPAGGVVRWTWSFVHDNWTNLTSAVGVSPSARWGEGLAYDAADGYVVLFGGCFNLDCTSVSNDTWLYAHDTWTNVTAGQTAPPPARGRTMMAYDAYDHYVLLFGGTGVAGAVLNDEWAFSGGHWASVGNLTSPRPVPRTGAAMAYDPGTGTVLLFGGFSSSATFGDTWSYQNGSWTNLTAGSPTAPSPRRLPMMAYDGADGYLMLLNGYSGGSYLGDEWSFSSGSWSPLSHRGGPEASFGGVLVYDPVDRYVVYFSGDTANGVLTSTLVYSGGTWTLLINPTYSSLTALGYVLVVSAIFAVMIALVALLSSRVRRKQEAKLGEGFLLPPAEVPSWVPTGTALRSRYFQLILPVVVLLVVFLPFLAIVALTGGGAGTAVFGLVTGLILLLLVVMMVWIVPRQAIRSIGIVRSGLILSRKSGELRVPWSQLQPGVMPPRKGWFWFQYIMPGKSAAFGGFSLTVGQARAILSSPLAPPWVLTEGVATGLGLPSRAAGPAPVGTPLTGAYAPWFLSPGPGAGPPPPSAGSVPPPATVPSPTPIPSAYYPPPPPLQSVPVAPGPAPSPYPTPAPAAARPPPGMRPCPNCGQVNQVGRVAFCTACGTRL